MSAHADRIDVLHVDDEPDLAELAGTLLEREDGRLHVEHATSAEEGLSLLENGEFDCVVSDYDMPGRNGIEFLEAVRERYPDLPFVLFTGKGSEEVASDAISAGVTDYMQKETGNDQYAVLANRVTNSVEQYHAQRGAERIRRRLTELSENTTDCLWMFDRDWEELLFISGYEEVWGRPEAAIRDDPQDFLNVVHPDDREFVRDAMDRLSNGESLDIEYRIHRGDGEQGWIWAKGEPVRNENGDVVRVVGFTRDITDRKQQRRRLETLIDNLPGIVYRSRNDPDWPMEFVRGECEELVGYTAAELESGDVIWGQDVLHPDEQDRMWEAVQTALDSNRPFEVTYRVRTKEGTTRWMWERGRLVESDSTDEQVLEGFITDITDRKEREKRLRETSAHLEALFEQSPDMINVHDAEGNIIDPNPALAEMTGYSEAELTDMKVWDLDEELDPAEAEALWRSMDYGDRERLEGVYRRRDGSTFPVEVHVRRVELDGDDRFVVTSRDITRRRESQRKREQIIDRTKEAVIEVDADWAITLVNERTGKFSGRDESDLLGADFRDVFSEARGTRFEEAYRESMRAREPVSLSGYYSGVDEWFDVDVYPNDDGGLAFYFLRVTEHRERERELEEANELLSTLFETLPVGVTLLDSDGRITRANERAVDVLGLTRSDITDRTYNDPEWEIFDENGDPIPDEDLPFARVVETGDPVFDYQHGVSPPDGTDRWLSINAAPIEGEGGVEQVVATVTDVTDSREYERAIRQQNERLEEFTSVVSHDLRNPLNVASGQLELAREECESDHLDAIGRAHERMETLVTDLLALAREGETATDITTVALAAVVENCWRNVDTADATLRTDLRRSVRADEGRLGQLFENLVRNAVEHGGSDVTVTVGELDDGFYVEDDGPGIPPEERDEVFEAGYSTSETGTGFGLSIVRRVAETHDWDLQITQGDSGGTRFEVTGVEFASG